MRATVCASVRWCVTKGCRGLVRVCMSVCDGERGCVCVRPAETSTKDHTNCACEHEHECID